MCLPTNANKHPNEEALRRFRVEFEFQAAKIFQIAFSTNWNNCCAQMITNRHTGRVRFANNKNEKLEFVHTVVLRAFKNLIVSTSSSSWSSSTVVVTDSFVIVVFHLCTYIWPSFVSLSWSKWVIWSYIMDKHSKLHPLKEPQLLHPSEYWLPSVII